MATAHEHQRYSFIHRYMPPTSPNGIPVAAVVFARLFVSGSDHGVKPFMVPLHDGHRMYRGVISK
jgi:acyl-CoA oxidase